MHFYPTSQITSIRTTERASPEEASRGKENTEEPGEREWERGREVEGGHRALSALPGVVRGEQHGQHSRCTRHSGAAQPAQRRSSVSFRQTSHGGLAAASRHRRGGHRTTPGHTTTQMYYIYNMYNIQSYNLQTYNSEM